MTYDKNAFDTGTLYTLGRDDRCSSCNAMMTMGTKGVRANRKNYCETCNETRIQTHVSQTGQPVPMPSYPHSPSVLPQQSQTVPLRPAWGSSTPQAVPAPQSIISLLPGVDASAMLALISAVKVQRSADSAARLADGLAASYRSMEASFRSIAAQLERTAQKIREESNRTTLNI